MKQIDVTKPFRNLLYPTQKVQYVGKGFNGYHVFQRIDGIRVIHFSTDGWGQSSLTGRLLVENVVPTIIKYLWLSTAQFLTPPEKPGDDRGNTSAWSNTMPGHSRIAGEENNWYEVEIDALTGAIVRMTKR